MISFQNRNFPTREILLPKSAEVLVATQSLNEKLFSENHHYVSVDAEQIDNQICYFVESEQIKLRENLLIEIITKQSF